MGEYRSVRAVWVVGVAVGTDGHVLSAVFLVVVATTGDGIGLLVLDSFH